MRTSAAASSSRRLTTEAATTQLGFKATIALEDLDQDLLA
jgi:hypothetical protein